jgi:hypothetical protein
LTQRIYIYTQNYSGYVNGKTPGWDAQKISGLVGGWPHNFEIFPSPLGFTHESLSPSAQPNIYTDVGGLHTLEPAIVECMILQKYFSIRV